jgi:two-component system sensor histidine kinase/response regulator
MMTPELFKFTLPTSRGLGLQLTHLVCMVCLLCLPFLSQEITGQELSAPPGQPQPEIVLQLKWFHQFNFAGYYAAVEQGYYAEAGLNVVIKEGQPGMDFIDEVVSGRANFGVEMPELLIARNQGKPVVVLAAIFQHSPQIMLSRADSQIKSPHNLINKRVMWRFDSAAELRAMLASEHVALDDINFMELSWDINDLIEGRVDAIHAYITDQPLSLAKAGVESSILQPINYGVDFYGDCLFTSDVELSEHPQRVKAFREASLRGWAYAMAHPEELMDVIRHQYHSQSTLEFMQHEYEHMNELMLPRLVEIGHMNPGRWKAIGDTFVKLGMLDPDYSLDGFLYDPNPQSDNKNVMRIIWALIFVLTVISSISIGLFVFNRSLNRKVLERTEHLSVEIAERKRSEKLLSESETKLSTIIQTSIEGYWMVDMEGRFLDVNDAYLKISGYERDEFLGMRVSDVELVESPDEVVKHLEKVTLEGSSRFESIHKRKDGRSFPVDVSVQFQAFEGGRFVVFLRDITERKQAEKELQESERKFKAMADIAPLAIYMAAGAEQKAEYINPTFTKLFGYTIEEVPTAGEWWPLAYPDVQYRKNIEEEWQRKIQVAIDTQSDIEPMEVVVTCKDGSKKNISWGFTAIGEQNWSFGLDLTERKRAENALREINARHFAMIENIGDVIAIVGPDGMNKYQSPNVEKWFGWKPEELLGNGWDFIHPEDVEKVQNEFQKLFKKKNPSTVEYRFKCKDGQYKWIEVTAANRFNDPVINGALLNYRDITQRKQAEEEIHRHREHLEELVGERTALLQEQNLELAQKRKELEEADRLKSEFLANMSHELRTPLNAIMTLSNVLASGAKDRLTDEENHYLEIVERNGGELLQLINDILDLSKIESGKSEIVLSKFPLGSILDTIKDNISVRAEIKGLTLDLIVPADLPLVTSDASMLYQVFSNVISNAVKFTEAGSVKIILKQDTKNIYVDIKDTGIGIREAELPHIFDHFRQGDGSLSRKYEGTGLGLAIAHRIMSLLGGKIAVKSELEKGSVFTITIPIEWTGGKVTAPKAEIPQPKPSRKKENAQPTTELKNILVVEDNPDNMITIKALLKGKFHILESMDGKHGLEKAIEKLPDLILLDMILPEMSGIEVAKILKSNKETQHIPIIAVTASVMPQNRDSFLKAGCDAIVGKPIGKEDLLNTIDEWLVK